MAVETPAERREYGCVRHRPSPLSRPPRSLSRLGAGAASWLSVLGRFKLLLRVVLSRVSVLRLSRLSLLLTVLLSSACFTAVEAPLRGPVELVEVLGQAQEPQKAQEFVTGDDGCAEESQGDSCPDGGCCTGHCCPHCVCCGARSGVPPDWLRLPHVSCVRDPIGSLPLAARASGHPVRLYRPPIV
jgi:hypothetical protein